jgi:hypothetical protein
MYIIWKEIYVYTYMLYLGSDFRYGEISNSQKNVM